MTVDVDKVFNSVGVWGRWQFTQLILIQIQHLAAAFNLLAIVFLGYEPPFHCLNENGTTIENPDPGNNLSLPEFVPDAHCKVRDTSTNQTSSCNYGYQFNSPLNESTIVTEWGLVCDKEYQVQLSQTILICGQALGATLMTTVADRFGRRGVCIVSQLVVLALAVGSAFAPNILVFSILRFPLGAFQQGVIMTGSVLPIELIPSDRRAMAHLFGSITWTICLSLISVLGYAFRNYSWRHLQLAYSSASIVVLLHIFLLDESLRWLYANGKHKEAVRLVRKIIRKNKAPVDEVLRQCLDSSAQQHAEKSVEVELSEIKNKQQVFAVDPSESPDSPYSTQDVSLTSPSRSGKNGIAGSTETNEAPPKYSLLDVWRSRRLLITTLITCFAWIVNSLVYFGLTLASSKLVGDRFMNFFLLAVVELPAGIISYVIMQWLGRKATIVIFDAVAGLTLITAVAIKTVYGDSILITALIIAGKFGASAAFGSLFTYTPELYPTNLRGLGLGMSSSASRIGGMIAPFSVILVRYVEWAPGTIFGGLSFIVCGLICLLPETRDKVLPQTVEEIEQWSKKTTKTSGSKL